MRLTTPASKLDLKPLWANPNGASGAIKLLASASEAGAGLLSPILDRIHREVRKRPKVAKAVDTINANWWSLVDAFCTTIDPLLVRFFPDVRLVAVIVENDECTLYRVVKGRAAPLGPLAALDPSAKAELANIRWSAIELRLAPERVLQRNLQFPEASREFLAAILKHRLERLTPWSPDKVLYGFKVLDGVQAGSLDVALLATSKDFATAPFARLAEAGLAPTIVGAADGALDTPLAINLLEGGAETKRSDSRRWVSSVMLTTFAVLAFSAITTAMIATSAVREQDESARELVKARLLLRNASSGAVGNRERALIDAKQPERAVVVLVDKLAGAIPADTFLNELSVTPDRVRLLGESGNAPALVAKLESAGLVNPRFTSSITREKSGKDSFEITADRAASKTDEAP